MGEVFLPRGVAEGHVKHTDGKIILFTGGGFLFLWFDIALGHVSAGLKHPGMWVPLLFLPCAVVVSILTALLATPVHRRLFRMVCQGALVIGLLGFGFHLGRLLKDLRGVIQWGVLIRLVRYPPLVAPLAVSGLGMLGLLVQPPAPRSSPADCDRSDGSG